MKKSIFAIAALAMGMTFAACGNTAKAAPPTALRTLMRLL